jgi:hypothetical protein
MDIRYLAGYVDGEGSFGLSWSQPGGHVWYPRLNIATTHRRTIKQIADTFGHGAISRKTVAYKHYKEQWSVSFGSPELRTLLPDLIPFLIEKRQEAEVCLLLAQSMLQRYSRMNSVPSAVRTYRLKLVQQFKQARKER